MPYDATQDLDEMRTAFSKDEMTIEELEDEVELWEIVKDCPLCDPNQLCTTHYSLVVGQ